MHGELRPTLLTPCTACPPLQPRQPGPSMQQAWLLGHKGPLGAARALLQHRGTAWRGSLRRRHIQTPPRPATALAPAADGLGEDEAPAPPAPHLALPCLTAAELLALAEARLADSTDDEALALAALELAAVHRQDPEFWLLPAERDAVLAALERLLRRNVVAFTPDQLGSATRCYVVLGGSSQVVLGALQEEACNWAGPDYALRPLCELVWSLAWTKRLPAPAFLRHVEGVVQDAARDWRDWLRGARAGRLVMLLWGLAGLRCQPCEGLLEAASDCLARLPLAGVSSKTLVTLLWALARLEAAGLPAVEAISAELCTRMEQQLSEDEPLSPPSSGVLPPALSSSSAAAGAVPGGQAGGGGAAAGSRQQRQALAAGGGWYSGGAGGSGEEEEGDELEAAARSWAAGQRLAGAAEGDHPGAAWGSGTSLEPEEEEAGWGTADSRRGVPPAPRRWDEGDLGPGLLSTLLWAWAKLRHRPRAGLHMASLLLYGGARELTPADITRVLWGLAQLEYTPHQLLGALCARLQQPGVLPTFSIPQLAAVVHAFSALDYFPGEPLLDLIADSCLATRDAFDPRSLTHVLWSLARLGYVDETFYAEFVPVVLADIGEYSPAELADVARVYAKFAMAPEGLFEAVAERTVASMEAADIQDLLRILTAFHQLGLQPDALLAAVEGWANARLRQLPPQALTLALGTFARLGGPRSPSLLAAAEECVVAQLDRLEPAQLALVAWSFVKLDHSAPQVLDHAARLLVERTSQFGDKAVSNVLWALATERHPLADQARALDAVATNLQGRLKVFGAQSLSNIAWAYATLGHAPPPRFLAELGSAAKGQLPAFESQGLSLLVWALAAMGYRHDALLSGIDAYCISGNRLRGFEGQHLSNLLWGMAKVGYRPSTPFWKQAAHEATRLVADLDPQELFNIGWAFATLRLHPPRLLGALAAEAARRPFALSPQELSGLLWALARLRHGASAAGSAERGARSGAAKLLLASEEEVEKRGGEFEDRHLAATVWAWGELGHRPGARAVAALWAALAARASGLQPQPLCMLAKGLAALQCSPTPQLAAALTARVLQLAPRLKPFECGELLHSWLALGLRPEAAQVLEHLASTIAGPVPSSGSSSVEDGAARTWQGGAGQPAGAAAPAAVAAVVGHMQEPQQQEEPGEEAEPSESQRLAAAGPGRGAAPGRSRSLLEAAAVAAPLSGLVQLLGAMAELGSYPDPAFTQICRRLRAASPNYRWDHQELVQLGAALAQADEDHRKRVVLKRGLSGRVSAAVATSQAAPAARGAARDAAQAAAQRRKPQARQRQQQQQQQQQQGQQEQRWQQQQQRGEQRREVEELEGEEAGGASKVGPHGWYPPDTEVEGAI